MVESDLDEIISLDGDDLTRRLDGFALPFADDGVGVLCGVILDD
jgi:hypothetical protein